MADDIGQLDVSGCVGSNVSDGGSTFTLYDIRVTLTKGTLKRTWGVSRRYREFAELKDKLLVTFPEVSEISFPSKAIVKLNKNVIAERQQQLQQWLRTLLFHVNTRIGKAEELLSFLNANPPPVDRCVSEAFEQSDMPVKLGPK